MKQKMWLPQLCTNLLFAQWDLADLSPNRQKKGSFTYSKERPQLNAYIFTFMIHVLQILPELTINSWLWTKANWLLLTYFKNTTNIEIWNNKDSLKRTFL